MGGWVIYLSRGNVKNTPSINVFFFAKLDAYLVYLKTTVHTSCFQFIVDRSDYVLFDLPQK